MKKRQQTLDEKYPDIMVTLGEDLNISRNIKKLVIASLNKSSLDKEAAQLLGISDRTLNRYKHIYKIKKEVTKIKTYQGVIKKYS
jgi:hypothetical protein